MPKVNNTDLDIYGDDREPIRGYVNNASGNINTPSRGYEKAGTITPIPIKRNTMIFNAPSKGITSAINAQQQIAPLPSEKDNMQMYLLIGAGVLLLYFMTKKK